MNRKSGILFSILIALTFLFLNSSSSFSQQKDDGSPEGISDGTSVEEKSEGVPVTEVIFPPSELSIEEPEINEKKQPENIGTEKQLDDVKQEQENGIKENLNNDQESIISLDSQKNEQRVREESSKWENVNIIYSLIVVSIILSVLALSFSVYVFTQLRKRL